MLDISICAFLTFSSARFPVKSLTYHSSFPVIWPVASYAPHLLLKTLNSYMAYYISIATSLGVSFLFGGPFRYVGDLQRYDWKCTVKMHLDRLLVCEVRACLDCDVEKDVPLLFEVYFQPK